MWILDYLKTLGCGVCCGGPEVEVDFSGSDSGYDADASDTEDDTLPCASTQRLGGPQPAPGIQLPPLSL